MASTAAAVAKQTAAPVSISSGHNTPARKPTKIRANGGDHAATADSFMAQRMVASCISLSEARYAGITAATLQQAAECERVKLPGFCTDGFLLRYYNAAGKLTAFWRWRNNPARVRGFRRNTADPLHKIKYAQAEGTGCWLYWPRVKGLDWRQVLADPSKPVVIVEGELKALCLCLRGTFAVGIGGVWNFMQDKQLLTDLAALAHGGREIAILFDSDTEDKPLCCGARYALARQLMNAQARVHVLRMPKLLGDDEKTGADDYCRLHPRLEGVKLWQTLLSLEDAQAFAVAAEMYRMNSEYVINEPAGRIVRLSDGAEWDDLKFIRLIENQTVPGTNKAGEAVDVHAGKQWIALPWRNRVQGRVYQPMAQFCAKDALTYVYDKQGRRLLNNFTGWATVPAATKRGLEMVKRFWTALLDHHFKQQQDETPEQTANRLFCRRWFEQWWAYPVQNPGAKMHSCTALAGEPGGGKGLVGYMVQHAVYGRHFREVTQKNLEGNFNSYCEDIGLLMGSEITTSSTKFDLAEWFKHFITSDSLEVNKKYVPHYSMPNQMNAYFTTNYDDAFLLDDNDRRYCIWSIPRVKLQDAKGFGDEWIAACVQAMKHDAEFQAALHWHLLYLDMEGFDHKRPPDTPAKQVAKTFSHNTADAFVDNYLEKQTEKGWNVFRLDHATKQFQLDEANKRMGDKALLKAWRKRLMPLGRAVVDVGHWINLEKNPTWSEEPMKIGLWIRPLTAGKFMTLAEAARLFTKQWKAEHAAPKKEKY